MILRRVLLALGGLVAAGALGFVALAWRPAIAPLANAPGAFSPETVRAGEHLAHLGYCASCHTAEGGQPLAGGKAIATPFGAIHATNITPDPETGLGRWSLDAFARAMREGVDRTGRHLYPAFPYTHYTGLSDADVAALYAYVMTRSPVRAEAPANALPFPLDQRPLLAGWKLLFFNPARFAPTPDRDATWNRGAYLAESLSHCGACHSPRNALGALDPARVYEGGEAEGWWSPPLNRTTPAPLPWTEAELVRYLLAWDPRHGGAAGPMRPVVEAHRNVPEDEIRAIARYFATLYGPPETQARQPVDRAVPVGDPALARGRVLYAGACAVCHESGGGAAGGVPYTTPSLGHRTVITGPDPRNLVRVIRDGIAPRGHVPAPIMPAYGGGLDADAVADIAAYLRARFSAGGPWPSLRTRVRELMSEDPEAPPQPTDAKEEGR